jgi:hypothetical protein
MGSSSISAGGSGAGSVGVAVGGTSVGSGVGMTMVGEETGGTVGLGSGSLVGETPVAVSSGASVDAASLGLGTASAAVGGLVTVASWSAQAVKKNKAGTKSIIEIPFERKFMVAPILWSHQ